MKIKDSKITNLLLASYTIGLLFGGFTWLFTEFQITFQFKDSKTSYLTLLIFVPTFYFFYRSYAIRFNEQSLLVKLICTVITILGMFLGIFFIAFNITF